jgi:hypothetical protein
MLQKEKQSLTPQNIKEHALMLLYAKQIIISAVFGWQNFAASQDLMFSW